MTNAGVTTTYTYDKNNRLTGSSKTGEVIEYAYDNNGNQTEVETNGVVTETLTYDKLNRQTASNSTTYTYRADGLRNSKTVSGTTTTHVWSGNNIWADLTSGGNRVYIWGINLVYNASGSTRTFYMYNAHGDVVHLTADDGDKAKDYDYDAFGNERNIDYNDTNLYRYCGEYFDKETGRIYLRARYYNPKIGRFISEDPIGNGLNWYTYCANSPIVFIDPLGLSMVGDEHLSDQAQETIFMLGRLYQQCMVKGDTRGAADAHVQAQAIRAREKGAVYIFTSLDVGSINANNTNADIIRGATGQAVFVMICETSDDFVNGWNSMGNIIGQNVNINTVITNVHGYPMGLYAGDQIQDEIDLAACEAKTINRIILVSCETGSQEVDFNCAQWFLTNNNVNTVIAPEGAAVGGINERGIPTYWSSDYENRRNHFIMYTQGVDGFEVLPIAEYSYMQLINYGR